VTTRQLKIVTLLVAAVFVVAAIALTPSVLQHSGVMLRPSSALPDRITYRDHDYQGGVRPCERVQGDLAPAGEIRVLMGDDVPLAVPAGVNDETTTALYAEREDGCYVTYSLLGGP
jgi:hypothetical protein